jgi:hypothetical protein
MLQHGCAGLLEAARVLYQTEQGDSFRDDLHATALAVVGQLVRIAAEIGHSGRALIGFEAPTWERCAAADFGHLGLYRRDAHGRKLLAHLSSVGLTLLDARKPRECLSCGTERLGRADADGSFYCDECWRQYDARASA